MVNASIVGLPKRALLEGKYKHGGKRMKKHRMYGGHSLGIVFGIILLVLILTGGATEIK